MSVDPYHTEFVSWRVDHFSLFYLFSTKGGGGQTLSGKFHYFFLLNPSLRQEAKEMKRTQKEKIEEKIKHIEDK